MACQSSDMSLNEFTDENLSFLDMELEALQSIFINELEVKENEKSTTVSIDLYPATADKLDEQYVRMTLEFTLSEEYPERIPDIKIRNPRGLSDEELNSIIQDLCMIAESKKGNSMLFEMIDAAKEHLTIGNRPSGECAICLHGFSDSDVFTKTECYHYFHSHCLARYAKNFFENSSNSEDEAESKQKNEELLCPMCRIPIEFDEWNVDYPPPEESDENDFVLSEEMIELQKKMATLFQIQVKKGGIIDIEAEKNKYLIEISNVPSQLNSEEKPEQKINVESDAVIESKNDESVDSPISERKDYAKNRSRNFDHRAKNRNFNKPNESRNYERLNDSRNFERRNESRNYERLNDRNFEGPNDSRNFSRSSENRNFSRPNDGRNFNRLSESRNYNRQNESRNYNRQSESRNYNRQNENRNYNRQNENRNYNRQNESRNFSKQNDRSFNRPNEGRNYNRSNESRTNNRYGQRYGKQSFNHGNYDKYGYGKQNSDHFYRDESESPQCFELENKDASELQDIEKNEDLINTSSDIVEPDDVSETSEYPPSNSKAKYSPNFSRRYNRGYYHGRNNYDNSRRSGKSIYDEQKSSQTSHRYSMQRADESFSKYEKRTGNDHITRDDNNYKSDYKSGNYKHDNGYYAKQRYCDSRNNSQYEIKGAYGGKDAYSNSYNSRNNRYRDSKDREQYPERNYREKQSYRDSRDMKYKNSEDDAYARFRQGTRNYSGSRPERYSDKSNAEQSNNQSESLESVSQNQNGVPETFSEENDSSNLRHNSSPREKSLHKEDSTNFKEKSSNKVSAFNSNSSNILPNAFCESSDVTSRTVNPPPGFANPLKKVVYGLQGANPPPGFNRS